MYVNARIVRNNNIRFRTISRDENNKRNRISALHSRPCDNDRCLRFVRGLIMAFFVCFFVFFTHRALRDLSTSTRHSLSLRRRPAVASFCCSPRESATSPISFDVGTHLQGRDFDEKSGGAKPPRKKPVNIGLVISAPKLRIQGFFTPKLRT